MSKIPENPVYEATVYQIDKTDPLKGGAVVFDGTGEASDGFLNAGTQQLTNRTAYLKVTLDAHVGSGGEAHAAVTNSSNGFMSAADKVKLDGITAGAQPNAVTSVANRTGAVVLTSTDVGLGNVTNTSDANKPVSTAQQTALNLKANLASPSLTGTPLAPTATTGTNTTQIATTAFVTAAVAAVPSGTTNLGVTTSSATVTITSSTGTSAVIPTATTSVGGTLSASDKTKLDGIAAGAQVNTVTSVATRTGAVVLTKTDVGLANVDNTADTAKPVSTAQQTALNLKANLASPALTGTPTAPTATVGDNSTQIATTAFVLASIPVSSNMAYMQVQDQKTSGTDSGTPVPSTWTNRDLNTIVINQISGATLTSNTVSLPSGTYYIEASAPFRITAGNRLRIFNNTDSNQLLLGTTAYTNTNTESPRSCVTGQFTIAATKSISLQYHVSSGGTSGLGLASGRLVSEIYADLNIWKIA